MCASQLAFQSRERSDDFSDSISTFDMMCNSPEALSRWLWIAGRSGQSFGGTHNCFSRFSAVFVVVLIFPFVWIHALPLRVGFPRSIVGLSLGAPDQNFSVG